MEFIAVTGATRYQYQVKRTTGGTYGAWTTLVLTGGQYRVGGLTPGTNYTFRYGP